jgi:peptidoglycan/xylan/chitin deacetylase (PgdA/CDA1 family)
LNSREHNKRRPKASLIARARALGVSGVVQVARCLNAVFGPRSSSGFGILMYHRVADVPRTAAPPTYNVTPAQLRSQLKGLLERGFEAWPLARVLAAQQSGTSVPGNVFVVTFDDGYENNLTAALPILRELQVPATIFLATAFLDSDQPFPNDDWLDAGAADVPVQNWRPLTTAQCHELLASGLIELGAHTHTHQHFVNREADFGEDMGRCVTVLSERFGIDHPTFAFPYGFTSPQLVEQARAAGVRCALTTKFKCVRSGDDPFNLGRADVGATDTAATLAAKLSGWYEAVQASIRRVARPLTAIKNATKKQTPRSQNEPDKVAAQSPAEAAAPPELAAR